MDRTRFFQLLFPHRIWRMPKGEPPRLYLTFDDGPHPSVTPQVIQILQRYRARATFFCVGENVRRYPHLREALLNEGHGVANHTQHHRRGWGMSTQDYLQEVQDCAQHVASPWFRPPYGKMTGRQARRLRKLGYRIAMWDVLSKDYRLDWTSEQVSRRVIRNSGNGSVVVFHDSEKAAPRMLPALEKCLVHFSEKGYEFLPLSAG